MKYFGLPQLIGNSSIESNAAQWKNQLVDQVTRIFIICKSESK